MKRSKARGHRSAQVEIDPDAFFCDGDRKRDVRKQRQLCGQVQRALNASLAADFDDVLLNELWVARVEPGSTLAQLRVWVVARPDHDPQQVLARLNAVAAALRMEVAAAIHRSQTPSLSFGLWAEGCES